MKSSLSFGSSTPISRKSASRLPMLSWRASISMLFTSVNSLRSLGVFLKSIGSSTISYGGHHPFWCVVASRIAMAHQSEKSKLLVHTPKIDLYLKRLLIGSGVEFGHEKGPSDIPIVVSDDPFETIKPYFNKLSNFRFRHVIEPEKDASICFFWKNVFTMPEAVSSEIASRIGGCWNEFSWDIASQRKCSILITTDWETHFSYTMLGGKSVLVSGPAWPCKKTMAACGVSSSSIIPLKDKRAKFAQCHCSSLAMCHNKESIIRPCWNSFGIESFLTVFNDQMHNYMQQSDS